jgi:3-dehydroquinate dehydratase/shikimate dehydrogenase
MEGEANRTILFARALAFADGDHRKNFAYVDFEEDFLVPSLQDAAFAFGTRVIRSCHLMNSTIRDVGAKVANMRITGHEIAKIACMPQNLQEVTRIFSQAHSLPDSEQILCCMGDYGFPTRVLADKLHSHLTYTSPPATSASDIKLGHIDPKTLSELYHFQSINQHTEIFGITGFPLLHTLSPEIHNQAFCDQGKNAVYVPIRAKTIEEALEFADVVGLRGMSVTVPHKESVVAFLDTITDSVGHVGACNTIVRMDSGVWAGYNTDASGLAKALLDFTGTKNLSGARVSIIGAGGAAKAAAFAVKQLKGRACVFNRNPLKAKRLAARYHYRWAALTMDGLPLLERYSDLIIQTTPVGMNAEPDCEGDDPIPFYAFNGAEAVYDVIYTPETTPLLMRAKRAGCRVCNGRSMLDYQAYEQCRLFTGQVEEVTI